MAAGGFDWGAAGVAAGAPVFLDEATAYGVIIATLGCGAVGWLFAGRLGWSPNSAALLNVALGLLGGMAGLLFDATRFQFQRPGTAVLATAMTTAVAWLLRRSAVGRELRAIGEDAAAARLAGIDRGWPMFVAFALSALGMVVAAPVLYQQYSVESLVVDRLSRAIFVACDGDFSALVGILLCILLFFLSILPFLAIAACGGGLIGRGRVCLVGIVCAGLAVPMLLCALEWLWPENLWHLPLLAALALVGWRVQRQSG